MLLNRHFFIMAFSIFFIGVIFWWQNPVASVSAMAGGESYTDPYVMVKTYCKRLDYRQFDLAREMVAPTALPEHRMLEKELKETPFLSIQKVDINNAHKDKLWLKLTTGSVIDQRKEVNYVISFGQSERGLLITSIKIIP